MATVESSVNGISEAWDFFKSYVTSQNRFFFDEKCHRFLECVHNRAAQKENVFKKGTSLYRARLGVDKKPGLEELKKCRSLPSINEIRDLVQRSANPYSGKEIGIPPVERRGPQRCSAPGMARLYLADGPETACAEVRPYMAVLVSVACFEATRDLRLADFSKFITPIKKDCSTDWDVMWEIGYDFSKPVAPDDAQIDYLPTQIVAEWLKKQGWDGIYYESLLSEGGHSIALFSDAGVKEINATVRRVAKVRYETEDTLTPCPIKKAIGNALASM